MYYTSYIHGFLAALSTLFPITSSRHELLFLQSAGPAVRVCPTAPESPESQNHGFNGYRETGVIFLGEEIDKSFVGGTPGPEGWCVFWFYCKLIFFHTAIA